MEAQVRLCDLLCRLFLMLQAAMLDCVFFDLFPLSQYSFVAAEVDVGWCNVVEALMVALVVVVFHEGLDLTF